MKKSFSLMAGFLSLFLLLTMIGCKPSVNPDLPDVPGTVENTYDFKLVSADTDSITVSWKKNTKSYSDEDHVSVWIVSTNKNETYDSASEAGLYNQIVFNLDSSPSVLNCTIKKLSTDTEYTIYLLGYDFGGDSTYGKKVCEFSLKAKTAKRDYFSNVFASSYDGYVSLSWNKASGFDKASKIVISKKTDKEEDFTKVVEITDSTSSYKDTNYEFETKYTYKFEAFDEDEKLLGSKTETVTTKALSAPSKITDIVKDDTYADGILIKWQAQAGVDKYIVEVSPYSNQSNVTTIETTESSCFYRADIEKGDGSWLADINVKVTAVNSKGNGPVSDTKNLFVSKKTLSCSASSSNITDKTATITVSTPLLFKEAKVEYALLNSTTKTDIYMAYQESDVFELTELEPETKKTVYPIMKINYKLMDGTEKSITTVGSSLSFTTDVPEGFPKTITGLNAVSYADGVELTWDAQESVTKYVVGEFKKSSDIEPEKTYEVTENSFFREKSPGESIPSYFRVYAENELGRSKYCDYKTVSIISTYSISTNESEIGKTTATTALTLKSSSTEVIMKKAKIEYAIGKTSSDFNLYCDYQESNVFELTGLNFADSNELYAFAKIIYTLNDEEKVYTVTPFKFTVQTESFDAPAAPVVQSVTRGSAKLSFTPFTEEQLYGVDSADVVYEIKAYEIGKSYAETSVKTEPGVVTPVTVSGLKPATSYEFTVRAVKNGNTNYGKESERSVSGMTNPGVSKPVIKTLEEVSVAAVPSPMSVINVSFDPIEEDTDEEIMYGLEWEIFEGSAKAGNYAMVAKDALSEVTDVAVIVNGGNRYFVTLYAYSKDEGFETRVRSEPQAIQLKKVDDKQMVLGLYYTSAAGLYEGQIIDITNSKTWSGSGTFTPKSTTSTYSWGLMSNKGNYVVKFGLNSDMMAKTSGSVYLYYVQQYSLFGDSKIGETKLAQKTTTYFVAPDAACTALVTFADYSSKSPASTSSNDPWRMPEYRSSGDLAYPTSDKPTYKGISMTNLEQYMFNNGLYLGIFNSSEYEGAVGVSYRY